MERGDIENFPLILIGLHFIQRVLLLTINADEDKPLKLGRILQTSTLTEISLLAFTSFLRGKVLTKYLP